MSVSEKDRKEYEQGQRDRGLGSVDQGVTDLTGQHPDSEAYYKGRRDEQLDEDKEDE